jgi:hypothetical protein
MAAAGVITRFCSSAAAPGGLMPGVTSTMLGRIKERSLTASSAAQTSPSIPISRAWAARSATSSGTVKS